MTNAAHVPMSNSLFEFDGSANWRLELPSDILTTVTENKQQPLSICVYLSQVFPTPKDDDADDDDEGGALVLVPRQ